MRRLLISLALMLGALPIAPASATHEARWIEHEAPTPCATLCPTGNPVANDVCAGSPVPGSMDKSIWQLEEGRAEVGMWSNYDSDLAVCTVGPDPVSLGTSSICCGGCSPIVQPTPSSILQWFCLEQLDFSRADLDAAQPGGDGSFAVITYNYFEIGPIEVGVSGDVELIDNSFNAS